MIEVAGYGSDVSTVGAPFANGAHVKSYCYAVVFYSNFLNIERFVFDVIADVRAVIVSYYDFFVIVDVAACRTLIRVVRRLALHLYPYFGQRR